MSQYITYLRLSRDSKNGRNYGLDAQRRDLDLFLGQCCPDDDGCLEIASYLEVQSGAQDDRPQLHQAISHAKKSGATLLVAKLDRLSRRVSFISKLLEDPKLSLKIACMPNADKFQLHIYSALAEQEREFISARTKAGLASAKEKGIKLGGLRPNTLTRNDQAKAKALENTELLRPILEPLAAAGLSLRQISQALAAAGTTTKSGNPWPPSAVKLALERLGLR